VPLMRTCAVIARETLLPCLGTSERICTEPGFPRLQRNVLEKEREGGRHNYCRWRIAPGWRAPDKFDDAADANDRTALEHELAIAAVENSGLRNHAADRAIAVVFDRPPAVAGNQRAKPAASSVRETYFAKRFLRFRECDPRIPANSCPSSYPSGRRPLFPSGAPPLLRHLTLRVRAWVLGC